MFSKTDIRSVTVAVERIFYQEVYYELGRQGIIHLSRREKEASDASMDARIRELTEKTKAIIANTGSAMKSLKIDPSQTGAKRKTIDIDRDSLSAAKVRKALDRAQRLRTKIREQSAIIAERAEYCEALSRIGVDLPSIKTSRLINMAFGTVKNTEIETPAGKAFTIAGCGRYVLVAGMPSEMPGAIQFLKQYGFTDKTGKLPGAPVETLERRANTLKQRAIRIDEYLEELKYTEENNLREIHFTYMEYEKVLEALQTSIFSSKAMFVTGWMDIREKPALCNLLYKICGDRFAAVISDTQDDDAPVLLQNARLLQPFELIVKTMGMPSNKEIDPTPLTAITYILMFGLMFGDLGQGLVLSMCGLFLRNIAKRRNQTGGTIGQAGGLLTTCGISAAICGILYGSLFSSEKIIPALLFHPAENIMTLFALTILTGAFFISIGLCVNIVNNILKADYSGALFENRGLAILIPYIATVLFSVRFAVAGQTPALLETSAFVITPLALFAFRGLLGQALFNTPGPRIMSEYVTMTCVEILDIFLGLFANTVSFIRVGAFALSHAGLSMATYTLAAMIDPEIHSFGAIIAVIIGNIFIIGFEGLVCGIQSLRLEYYEFFGKFFKGDGAAFAPFTLTAKT